MNGSGDHAVRVIALDHHGSVVHRILHDFGSLFRRDPFLLAQFVKLIGVFFEILGRQRIDDPTSGDIQRKVRRFGPYLSFIAQQDNMCNAVPSNLSCRRQIPFFLAFWQDDGSDIGFGLVFHLCHEIHGSILLFLRLG
ncbi:hypothetical protein SDC9_164758 [bioreactor metagenome]|uniref:Uncharacterized protein n=1 Tax=bioreactor metagenome TaxID=1076179 RepID=A0A645FSH4_9ZZZZ